MTRTSPSPFRGAAAILAVFAVGVLSPALFAQVRFPQAGGSVPVMPNSNPQPAPVMPNFNPQAGGSTPIMPNFNPQPAPTMPNPQPFGSGAPNFPPQPVFVTVWTCDTCGKELGRGPVPPTLTNCPYCGVRLVGVRYAGDNPTPSASMPLSPPGGTGSSAPSVAPLFSSFGGNRAGTVVVGVLIVVVGLAVLGGAAFLIAFSMGKRRTTRRRRRRFDED